jgi:molecular chaperone HscB
MDWMVIPILGTVFLPVFQTCGLSDYLCAMNYFEFYGINESFTPDVSLLKKKFYELSKEYHPDFYANEDDEKQQEILELSTLNNKAWQTLSDHYKRLEYILKQHDLLQEGAKPQLPADFLMEMMDINERLMEIEDADELAKLTSEVLAIEDDIKQKLEHAQHGYAQLNDTAKEERLNEIADCYYRQKYLLRIKESLDTFAARFN